MNAAQVLLDWLTQRLDAPRQEQLAAALASVTLGGQRALEMAFSGAARLVGRAPLAPTTTELAAAACVRPEWDPSGWTNDEAARVLLVLRAVGTEDPRPCLDRLCRGAELAELLAIYRGLPLYPQPALLSARAAEGLRSNMTAVFCAVAQRNPYPADHLGEEAWNQLVLKCLFTGAALHPVVGLERRCNPRLARMLGDYAHERWAANRPFSPELWRCVGPCADQTLLGDLERALIDDDPRHRQAAALALQRCPHPQAAAVLGTTVPTATWPELAEGEAP